MILEGPDRYAITIHRPPEVPSFEIEDVAGARKFSGRATSNLPKLYIVSVDERPIYVGITKQSMRNRLRYGWTADGSKGYHGYRWRHHFDRANLDVWYHIVDDNGSNVPLTTDAALLDIETVEAEVVYLVRGSGNWPEYQTEIHFHPSSAEHREIAERVHNHYNKR